MDKNNTNKLTNKEILQYALSTWMANTGSAVAGGVGNYLSLKDIFNYYKEVGNKPNNHAYIIKPRGFRRNRYATIDLDILSEKVAQNAFFLPKELQERYYNQRGYVKNNESKSKNIFKKALRGREVDTYRINKDVIDRKSLRAIGNIHGLRMLPFDLEGTPYKYMEDPKDHSAIIYQDENGDYYFNSVDLNDYGKYGLSNVYKRNRKFDREDFHPFYRDDGTGVEYGAIQILAELADVIGNPTILETGVLPLDNRNMKMLRDHMLHLDKRDLSKIINDKEDLNYLNNTPIHNEDITRLSSKYKHRRKYEDLIKRFNTYLGEIPDDYIYKGDSIEPIVITPNNKKFGGKLKFKTGGTMGKNKLSNNEIVRYAIATYLGNKLAEHADAASEPVTFKHIYDYYRYVGNNANLESASRTYLENGLDTYFLPDTHRLIRKTEQNAHFLPKRLQERYYSQRGYEKNNTSGAKNVFKKALRGRNVNTYRLNQDVTDRKKLKIVSTIHSIPGVFDMVDGKPLEDNFTYLSDPFNHSAAIYKDKYGNYYINALDFNDYGKFGLAGGIKEGYKSFKEVFKELKGLPDDDKAWYLRHNWRKQSRVKLRDDGGASYGMLQPAAELLDIIGNPAIIETGVIPLTKERASKLLKPGYLDDETLKGELKSYIDRHEDTIDGGTISPVVITPETMKKFGGKLRYGWGGIKNYWDYATPYLGTADSGSYSNRDGRLAYEKHVNASSLFGSDYVSRSANEVISDKGWDPEKSYVYIQGQGYIPYAQLTDTQKNATGVHQGIYTITDDSMISALQAKDQSIYAEMQNKIDQDVARNQKLITNIARFGGMIGVRRKYPYGGTYTHQSPYSGYIGWGTEVKPENISYTDYNAQGEGIIGKEIATYATSGLGVGASIGGLLGSVIPGIGNILGTLIGAGVGAASGAGIGAGIGSQNKKEEEANRRALIAEQRETNRQNTISNMNYRYENDVAKIRTATQPTTFSGQSFYMKHGGLMKPRMKYNNGGTILPNSSDTAVAYGRTHEQIDPMTGETGITYGNAEVEGGGLIGNKELPGEVIQQTPNGDRIYSDSLYVPGTRATYAQIAKALTDKKGVIEQEISTLQKTLDTSLDTFNKTRLAKAKTGTATRNIEKIAAKLNIKTGELAQVDAQLNDIFESQEQMATVLGLRDTTPVAARFGGYRPKYKFGIPEAGLVANGLSFIGNMLATGLSSKSNRAALDFMSRLSVPKTNKVEAEYHDIDTTPYEEASRKMNAEARRFNKWIEDNVNNPQLLRNQKRKVLIDYYEGLGDINAKKSAYLTSRYDANRNAHIVARNTNNQGEYQDALNEYNKGMQIANTRMSVDNQTTQNYMASMNQLMQAFGIYGNQKMYLASLPQGVQNEFYFGNGSMKDQLGLTGTDIRGLRRAGVDVSAMRGAFRQSNNDLDYLLYLLNR